MHQGFHRELITGNTRPLGPSGGSRLSATSGGSSNSVPNPTRVEVPNGLDRIDHCRGTRTLRHRCHQFSSGRCQGFHIPNVPCPQKDRGYRPVINLRALNNYILEEHFKMEGFHMVKEMIKPQDWLVKIDLKDTYLSVPIHPNHRKYLQFHWQSLKYQFNCLPFGLSCAPRVFTKLMKPVVAFLREKGMRLIIYLDDILVMCQCQEELTRQVNLIQDLFSVLGSDNQQQEVTVVTSARISISEAPDINRTNKNSSPKGEDPENLWRSNSSCRKIDGNNLGAGYICGNDQCIKAGDPYSSLVSPSHTGPDKQGGGSSRAARGETTIPKNGSPHTGSPGRTSVVGQDCQDIQFCPINTTTSRSSNRDRCILVGLGCQVPGAP